ncbi:sigma-70 family RNA polymerase sigma factor [Dyadobacter chenwenxiniae]|uniref:Sigma-70 family RNA polymerase sigma factor n=1 Tax=Dyadobacter chenwenxiniae TaxID=2906456 RepID=A0A9X1PHZ3_9BACT|nr:sigma-70 family RNA polymerase sigma factor [Dyadobacter chenwenxiniae]MCF0061036.1 sigma-70 family RNA polymerase sigma factor [Dyadobacter chenwenxiniae]UON80864.1 sigma-70 family RNA polymerase sigma factor [Dyadobacter chenwenxiniae]
MKNQGDQIHIDNVKKGELTSFTFLVDKYKNMAYTIAVKILGNAEDAEDAAQESFVKAYLQINAFQGNSKFSTWLYTIVYRTSVSKLQKNKLQFSSLNDELTDHYEYDHATPEIDHLQVAEREKFVKEAIEKLPKIESLLITLYYMNENSIDEIEEITGLSAANIKVKLFRARKILGKELQFLL